MINIKVPEMISTKDLSYINDMFNWNMTMAQKLDLYLQEDLDNTLIKSFKRLRKLHLDNCCKLISILKGE